MRVPILFLNSTCDAVSGGHVWAKVSCEILITMLEIISIEYMVYTWILSIQLHRV